MKPISATRTWLGLSFFALASLLYAELPPLPQWDDDDLRDIELYGPGLGGTLFPRMNPDAVYTEVEHTEIAQEEMETPEVIKLGVAEDLPADLVESYLPETLEARVVDPQSLLTQARLDGILHFLDYHFREARSAIHILVLRPLQRLPSHLDLQEIHRQWFGDSLSVLVVYNFGNPEMSRLIFGAEAERRVPEARRVNACVESINDAMVASNADDQLERFLMELSRKLYWVEDVFYEADRSASTGIPAPPQAAAPVVETMVSKKKLWFSILSAASVLIMAGAVIVTLQRRASTKTFYYPERRYHPRLGAPYGGGNRLVVSFGEVKAEPSLSVGSSVPD